MNIDLKNKKNFNKAIKILYKEMGSYYFDVGLDAGGEFYIDYEFERHAEVHNLLSKNKIKYSATYEE